MGNFTINQYSALTVGSDRVDLLYVVDMAEIPAFQELGTIRPDHSTGLTQAERDAYTTSKSAELLKGLSLSVDGNPLQLSVTKSVLSFPSGAGGLPTLRLEISLTAPTGAQRGTLQYSDANYKERTGWREIIANPAKGTALSNSSVPTTDRSNALRNYSPDLLQTPPNVTSATVAFAPGAASPGSQQAATQPKDITALSWAQGRADALTDLIAQKELPLGAFLLALLIAFAFGAGHALSPGHGKTVVAAYLVGSKGTPWHALLLGITVTISHTIGVFLLGLVVLYAADYILPEQLYPWLGFTSGMLVAIMGVALFVQRFRAWRRADASRGKAANGGIPASLRSLFAARRQLAFQPAEASAQAAYSPHDHEHEHHFHAHPSDHHHDDHDHDHGHDHNHPHDHDHSDIAFTTQNSKLKTQNSTHKHGPFSRPHSHLPADGQKTSLRSLLALGIAGGIIPCPSALVVLLVAIASHRVALGLVLILAFSFGLAAVLTGIGLLMVFSRSLLNRFNFAGGILGRIPMLPAVTVACLGLLIAYEALKTGGILR
jgi:ABC-type nickel/cobalt efflux system permease component RcnA